MTAQQRTEAALPGRVRSEAAGGVLGRLWRNDAVRRFRRHRAAQVGAAVIAVMALLGLLAPVIAPYGPEEVDLAAAFQGPSARHLFGADSIGRDIFSRVLYGARYSLTIGLVSVGVGLLIGLPLGLLSGYRGGRFDAVVMRVVDILFSFPTILLALIVVTVFGTGLFKAMIAIGIAQMPVYARLTRAVVLKLRSLDYVEAAHALGARERRILAAHILPNAVGPIVVESTLQLASAILSAAYLGFLGLGAEPGTPEWGTMLSEGRNFLVAAPHVTIFPGLAIVFAILSLNLVGDGLRDALEPRLKR